METDEGIDTGKRRKTASTGRKWVARRRRASREEAWKEREL